MGQPPWLLSLLWLLWTSLGAGTRTFDVQAPAQVRGFLGDRVELECKLPPMEHKVQVTQATWTRRTAAGNDDNVAVFHPTQGSSFPKPGRLEFVAARRGEELRDATLALGGLRAEDEGNYTCRFAVFPDGSQSARIQLHVLAQPENEAEAQEGPLGPLGPEPVPVARCVSRGGLPPARISWSPPGGRANESQVPGHLPGTTDVVSILTVIPSSQVDGQNVTCRVEHESFQEAVLLPVALAVPYPPEVSISGYDDNWYLGRRDASLNCDVRSKPEPTGYDWSTTTGVFPASAVAQGPQLIIHSVDKLVNTTFICTVTNAVGTGHAEQVVLVRDTPRASPRDVGPVVWGAVGGTLLVLLLLAGGSLAFILLRVRRRRKSPGGGGGGADHNGGGSYDPKTQVFGNGGPVFWTPAAPGPLKPDGKDEEDEEDEEKAEEGLMLPPPKALEDDMESQLDGSLISRRAIYV
uniref:Nectin cell adhesion molecule 2 n=1 Tax=Suricata suricatta TaxID=37032 RepID=A0A673V1V3_SURSU